MATQVGTRADQLTDTSTYFQGSQALPYQGGEQSQGVGSGDFTGGESFDYFSHQQASSDDHWEVPYDYLPREAYEPEPQASVSETTSGYAQTMSQPQQNDTREAIERYSQQQTAQQQAAQQQAAQQQQQAQQQAQQQGMPVPNIQQQPQQVSSEPQPSPQQDDFFEMLGTESKRERTEPAIQAAENGSPLAQRGLDYARRSEFGWAGVEEGREKLKSMRASEEAATSQVRIGDAATRSFRRVKAQVEQNQQERDKPFWLNPIDRLVRLSSNMMRRTGDTVKKVKRDAARAFKREGLGNRVWGKIIGDGSLSFREVGIGIQEIIAVQQQDYAMLDELLAPYLGVGDVPISTGTMTTKELIDVINKNNVYVATFKPPNNQGPDIQRRRLRIMENHQRGIFLHNIMAAMYTADYDGDDMEISLDPTVTDKAKDPMDHIYDIFGKTTLNMDFIKVVNIEDVTDEDGNILQTRWEYVRDTILADLFDGKVDGRILSPLIQSILDLSETAFQDDDARAKAFGDMLRSARTFADKVSNKLAYGKQEESSDDMMSSIVRAVFDNMREIAYQNALTTIGADVLTLETEDVPEPVTYGDNVLYTLLDGMVNGTIPNNFQEVKLLLTGFAGNVDKKNAPFRFTADVGKMAKMDSRLLVGNEYVVDVNNEEHLQSFFISTAKYAASLRMMRDIKKDGRKDYYMQLLRQKVIEEVGFPETYPTFSAFLVKFSSVYNRHAMTINEANKVFLTNMGVSTTESHGLVSAIKTTPQRDGSRNITLNDVAEPLLTVYGKYSVRRVFYPLVRSGIMSRDKNDVRWVGRNSTNNAHLLEREYDQINSSRFWITGKYLDYSLRKFRNENRLPGNARELKTAINRLITDTSVSAERLMFDTMLAIADKRTGAASTFNLQTFGAMEGGHDWNEKTTTKMMSQLLTTVAAEMRQGGLPIAPGYYAGIGSRNAPEDARAAMTKLAGILANQYGYVLRSGDTKGSDQAFAMGAGRMAISFVANDKHKMSKSGANSFKISFESMSAEEQNAALDSIQRLHPNPDSFAGKDKEYVRSLMARNYYQVVGRSSGDFDSIDSAFVACYATDDDNDTWHAIRLAHERGIPVFNLAEYSNPEDWINDVTDAARRSLAGQLYTDQVGQDQALRVEGALNALISANRDMFMYFGMDSPATFLDSAYGRKLLQYANDPEMIGGIYTSMVFDWRMERITSLTEEVMSQQTVARFQKVWDDLNLAKDELSSASEVWHGIIREFEMESTKGEMSFFEQMRKNGHGEWDINGRNVIWGPSSSVSGGITFDAADFWFKGGLDKYRNLRQVIDDLDLDRRTKWNIITDVVRYWEKDGYLKSYEVGYQLEIGNDSTYTLGSAPSKAAMESHRDFEQAFGKWGRSGATALREDVERARATFGTAPGILLQTLTNLDKQPWELVSIDDGMYADAVLAVYDKTYAQTEKANQNPWTNAIYSALSLQQNGGYMNDVTRTNDRLLGITAAESITVQDIIHLLANPDEIMTISVNGDIGIISRDILLDSELRPEERTGDVEQDIWEFLNRQPRIASAIRKHSACVSESSDGEGYLGAMNSITETIMLSGISDTDNQVKYILRDHPAYAAIMSLALPGRGLVTRNARNRMQQVEKYFVHLLRTAASDEDDSMSLAPEVLEDMGITRKSIRAALKSDYDTYLEGLGLDARKYLVEKKIDKDNSEWILESERDADDIFDYAVERVSYYINELRNAGISQPTGSMRKPSILGEPDAVSAASFWDVVQELSGAKTSVSTGIEGGETYRHAEWISHIRPKDRFVDIMSLNEDEMIGGNWNGSWIDESWNGAWTSLTNQDGSPVLLEVNGDRTSISMTRLGSDNRPQTQQYFLHPIPSLGDLSFKDALDTFNSTGGNISEISVLAPEGYEVKDKSTDTHGLQVPSLFAYMISKRTNGAEAFNLKAKKAGIDGKDSITKKLPGGEHKIDNNTGKNVNFFDILDGLRQTHASYGFMAAQLELAKMMLAENTELGYEDLTLSNYMSIADIMLFEGDDGQLYLRSVEMLSSAIKDRIGWRGDNMSEDDLFKAVQEIVDDKSETAVGRKLTSSIEAFDSFRPRSKASQHNAVRQQSSVFERNYPLLESILKDAKKIGVEPMDSNQASDLNEANTKALFADVDGKWIKGTEGIRKFLSGYNLTTIVGIGHTDISNPRQWTIGPSNAAFFWMTNDVVQQGEEVMKREVEKAYRMASRLGMSVVMHRSEAQFLPEDARKDMVPADESGEYVLVPCFDSRLNGSEATPSRGQWEISQTPFSKYVVSVEDSLNEFGLGDAEAQAFKALTDRMSKHDSGSQQINMDSLFPNVFKNPDYKDCQFSVGLANGEVIMAHIANGVDCTIDYGIAEGAKSFARQVRDVSRAVQRYQQRWGSETNPDGLLMGVDLEPGDIVGWYQCEIIHPDGHSEYVLAPIIPFPLHGVKRQPSKFRVENIGPIDNDHTLISVDWSNSSKLTDGYVKYFDSSGGANKGMISLSATNEDTRVLLDGTKIDIYIAKESTDSRKVGTDRRIKTMISLMTLARMHGYNFARNADGTMNMAAFPENPTIDVNGEQVGVREALYRDRISITDWKDLLSNNIRFVSDDGLDAFIRFECNKVLQNGGNPSDYLANLYTDEDGNESNTHVMWEFEAMFEQGLNYEDGLLKFLRFVNPVATTEGEGPETVKYFCPNGMDDATTENTLFRLCQNNGEIAKDYDRGILQMRVPHKMSDGRMAYAWDNVSIGMSFFGEEYSGFSRPNVEGASNFLDGMNTMSMYGVRLRDDEARHRYEWASADQARPRSNGSLEAIFEREQ